jgi:hypothetical protein
MCGLYAARCGLCDKHDPRPIGDRTLPIVSQHICMHQMSFLDPSDTIKPNPLAGSNHFTLPVASPNVCCITQTYRFYIPISISDAAKVYMIAIEKLE